MKKPSPLTELSPVRREVVTPQEYLRLTREQPHLIARSRFVAPGIGRPDFGGFEVQYSVPLYKRVRA